MVDFPVISNKWLNIYKYNDIMLAKKKKEEKENEEKNIYFVMCHFKCTIH